MRIATMLLGLACIAPALAPPARADDFLGGEGGVAFGPVNCPRGQAVVGIFGRSGNVIDTLQIICGKADGSPDMVDPRRIGPSAGGSAVSAVCPPLSLAQSIQVNVRDHHGAVVVSQITLVCELKTAGSLGRATLGAGGGGDAGSSDCPVNTFVAGFAGRAGSFIDAIGITTCRHVRSLN
ncbi:hypothetical protein ROS9278_02822 [Roseomonas sp. CECT 9278]|nr:hypothetical protein ROS9278_02822 [Roseomonas sp. CECT 9278]